MQFGDPAIVSLEKRHEIFHQITLIDGAQGPHDSEIHGDIASLGRYEDIAGMHVRMKETVTENLGKEDPPPPLCERLEIDALTLELRHIADGDTIDTLHDHHLAATKRPIDLGHIKQIGILKVAPQLRGIGRLAQQIEFVKDGLFVFRYHLPRPQPPPFAPIALRQISDHV